MCGIAGFFGAGGEQDLVAMMRALVHRGPDANGIHISESEKVFLGHQRLAVVDINDGTQPMWDLQQTVAVVFNGEIYNHLELRAKLQKLGYRFKTSHSDTEVLVYGWKHWGPDLLLKLNGMFAFAVYDKRANKVFLARDRFGEKPLYYAHGKNLFAFASELTALVQHSELRTELDPAALKKLFAYGYIPSPRSIYANCNKLPAGHWCEFDMVGEVFQSRQYWKFELEKDDRLELVQESELVDEFNFLLDQSVKRRLMSDVPLGIFLSGGLDSSSITASATRVTSRESINTFCIGFAESSFDESHYARLVAEHLGVRHSEKYLHFSDAEKLIPEVLSRLDEPFGDSSIIPSYLLSAFARQKITVALSGDGGDELFAGYDPFLAIKPAQIYDSIVPSFIHRLFRGLAGRLPISDKNLPISFRLSKALSGLSYPQKFWQPVWMAPLEPSQIMDLFGTSCDLEELYEEVSVLWDESNSSKSLLDRSLEFYTRFYLQENILFKIDRASMMNSLESRAVFLDNDLVDFCRRLPNRYKLNGCARKYLVKKAAAGVLPKRIIDRKKKGFGIPSSAWLRQLPEDIFFSDLPGLNAQKIADWSKEHRKRMSSHHLFLWTMMSANLAGRTRHEPA